MSVIAVVTSKAGEYGTFTYELVPLNSIAFPNFPDAIRDGLLTKVPLRLLPLASIAVVPLSSSKPSASTNPLLTAMLMSAEVTEVFPSDTVKRAL